jgi:hypothetical protein
LAKRAIVTQFFFFNLGVKTQHFKPVTILLKGCLKMADNGYEQKTVEKDAINRNKSIYKPASTKMKSA